MDTYTDSANRYQQEHSQQTRFQAATDLSWFLWSAYGGSANAYDPELEATRIG